MNKFKKYTFFLILSFLCLDNVHAACTQKEKENFKEIENKYEITYEYHSDTKKYTVYFDRANPDKYEYIIYSGKNLDCSEVDKTTAKCSNLEPGKYVVRIMGQTKSCNDVLQETTLVLPEYNKYYNDPLCNGIEEFVLCQETYDKEMDYETFKSRVETYKKSKAENEIKKQEEEKEQKEKEFKEDISNFFEENYINIIIVVIFIILVTITTIITAKQVRKSRRLE